MEKFSFNLADSSGKQQAAELTEMLKFCGVSVKIEKAPDDSQSLVIKINYDNLMKVKKRGAGRRPAANAHGYKVSDVLNWQKQGLSLDEILEKLEMKQATYYRRLKEYKDSGVLDNLRKAAKRVF